jgi:hypothetical protein
MTDATSSLVDEAPGFVGMVSCSTLADVIQLAVNDRFRGCMAVQHGECSGCIYFRDGEIVHAEHRDQAGEQAFYEIMAWPGGRFRLDAGVSSPQRSIQKNWQHLVLEAFRLHDERRAAGLPPAEPGEDSADRALLEALRKLRRTPGVACAVAQDGRGEPIGDRHPQAAALASDARYASYLGRQLGAAFGTGEQVSAALRRTHSRLLCFRAPQDLSIAVLLSDETSLGSCGAIREAVDAVVDQEREQPAEASPGGSTRRRRLGSLDCDWLGRVRANTFDLSRGPALAREVAQLVACGVGDLDGPVETVEAMEFRYPGARLVVERGPRGFSLALWGGPDDEVDPVGWAVADGRSIGKEAGAQATAPGVAEDAPPVLRRVCKAVGARPLR